MVIHSKRKSCDDSTFRVITDLHLGTMKSSFILGDTGTQDISHDLWNKTLDLINIKDKDSILGNYKRIIKNGLSELVLHKFQSEINEKNEYIDGFIEYYNKIISSIIPIIINEEPSDVDLQVTVSNTLYTTVQFDENITLKLEAFIRNKENPSDPISIAYSFFNNNKRVLARFEYFDMIEQTLNSDLSHILGKYSDREDEKLVTAASIT